jgi:hypothetical protein
METPEANLIASQYGDFMREIKIRLEAIQGRMVVIKEDLASPTAFLEAEFCILQVRFVCELLALAVLAAHRPLGLKSDLQKAWNARKIFETLAQMNAECFPKAANFERKDDGVHGDIVHDKIDRSGLQNIYDQCGEALHRGVLKHALSGRPKVYDIPKIEGWARQLGALLSSHVVLISDLEIVLIVQLNVGPDQHVEVAVAGGGPFVHVPPETRPACRPSEKPRRPRAKRVRKGKRKPQ